MGRLNFPQNTTIKEAYAAMANDSKFFIRGGVSICQAGVLFLNQKKIFLTCQCFLLALLFCCCCCCIFFWVLRYMQNAYL